MTGTLKMLIAGSLFLIISALAILLSFSRSDLAIVERDAKVLRSDNALQGQVIATQAFNFSRFNKVAVETGRLNSLIDVDTNKTVIKYREILRSEKTCDLPVPSGIANGLLQYTTRLRSNALHADTSGTDQADDRTISTSTLTYCQAVLWIEPLLAVIESGNNQLTSIRTIEQIRSENKNK